MLIKKLKIPEKDYQTLLWTISQGSFNYTLMQMKDLMSQLKWMMAQRKRTNKFYQVKRKFFKLFKILPQLLKVVN